MLSIIFQANLRSSRTTANLNILLYVGLGTVAVGLIITFVGLGEKGFKTVQLKMIGPGLVGCGLVLTIIRVISCTLPACYNKRGVSEKIKEEANGVIKNNLDNENLQILANTGIKVTPSLNGKISLNKHVRHHKKLGDNVTNRCEKTQKKMRRRQLSEEDDLSSSSTFSDTEDNIPPFLTAAKDKIAL